MLAPKPPKEMLIDKMVHKPYLGEGDYNKPQYGPEQAISYVRIDRNPQYIISMDGKQIQYNALVFGYRGLTDPLPDFKEQDVLVFDGVAHTITSAAMFKEPYADQVYSWELAVI